MNTGLSPSSLSRAASVFSVHAKAGGGKFFSKGRSCPKRKLSVFSECGFNRSVSCETAYSAAERARAALFEQDIALPHFSTLLRGNSASEPSPHLNRRFFTKGEDYAVSVPYTEETVPGMEINARSALVLSHSTS